MSDASPTSPATERPPIDVAIVLSSYNGAKFIGDQIESLRRQTFTKWVLLVRDDGSSDDTVAVVERLAGTEPRIHLVSDGRGNLGAAASFGALLQRATELGARYVALADQDDLWQPTKLGRGLELIGRREAELGRSTPLLVHSDLTVVAEDLSLIHPSFLSYQHLRHVADRPLRALLAQNFVTGCTVVVNRALLEAAVPLPKVAMHDWWLALCAAALGEILYLPEPTVLYRQHDRNAIGSKGWRQVGRESVRRPYAWWRQSAARFTSAVQQARELARRVEALENGGHPPSPASETLREFAGAFGGQGGPLRRLRIVRRQRIQPRSLLPVPIFFYLRVLLWSAGRASADRSPTPGRPAIFNAKDGHA